MKSLQLRDNLFTGEITENFFRATSLETLDLSENHLNTSPQIINIPSIADSCFYVAILKRPIIGADPYCEEV